MKYKAMLERQMTCKDVSDVSDLDIDDFIGTTLPGLRFSA